MFFSLKINELWIAYSSTRGEGADGRSMRYKLLERIETHIGRRSSRTASGGLPQDDGIEGRSSPWTTSPATRRRSAPRTSTRATTGAGRLSALGITGVNSKSGSIIAGCTAPARPRQAGAGKIRAWRAARLRRQQYPLLHLDQDRRVGARQAVPLGADHAHQQRSDPVGFRLGGGASQALHALAQAGELQGRPDRAARHRRIPRSA